MVVGASGFGFVPPGGNNKRKCFKNNINVITVPIMLLSLRVARCHLGVLMKLAKFIFENASIVWKPGYARAHYNNIPICVRYILYKIRVDAIMTYVVTVNS